MFEVVNTCMWDLWLIKWKPFYREVRHHLTSCCLQIKQFGIIGLASFSIIIQNISLINDTIYCLPLCKSFKCQSNKLYLNIMCFPLRIIGCSNPNGSSAWHIHPKLMMFSYSSGFKDKILFFHGTLFVWFWVEQYLSGKVQCVLIYRWF